MNTFLKHLILLFFLYPLNGFTQVEIESNKLLIPKSATSINSYFVISKKDSTKLTPNQYKINFIDPKGSDLDFFLLLTIEENQSIKSPILFKHGTKKLEIYLDNGRVIKRKMFYPEIGSKQLETEEIVLNDTIYESRFNKLGKITYESRSNLKNKTLYYKSYDYDEKGNLQITVEENKLLGVSISSNYNNKTGILTENTYSDSYPNGHLKTLYPNGNFQITEGNKIKYYNKDGKLIKSYFIEEEAPIKVPNN
ncbi:hypothetical protein [Aquimarina aquimarini]|uniref:hypothetical protein n=1 Tax=Aquimarina aquimarini TaxID=1191734 RepID=UPI00131EEE5D|nr:hypothetical protein [Aquimarina aquimarini]